MGGSPSSRREEQLEFPSSGCEQGIRGGLWHWGTFVCVWTSGG